MPILDQKKKRLEPKLQAPLPVFITVCPG